MDVATKLLLSGNEAIALGAYEAGVALGCGYPGTPSTEIIETLAQRPDVYTEWSVNEKVALEVGLGAALAGGRALVTMKHVGLNVAADPLFTSSYTGVNAGLVVVTADDPAMHSSQNEQDSRNYALAAKLPMFEPADAAQAREFTRAAFELSEAYDTPVLLRSATRLSHSTGVVEVDEDAPAPQRHALGFNAQPSKYVMIPGNARRRRLDIAARWQRLTDAVETHPANSVEHAPGEVGVITSGVAYQYVKEVMPQAGVCRLGIVHPLPRRLITEFARQYRTVYVVEELDPVIETQVRAWGIDCHGKDVFPSIGEFSPGTLRTALGLPQPEPIGEPAVEVPPRFPALCVGCPHAHVYNALRERGMIVAGDIGCYSLGVMPPYSAMDTLLDMGASVTMAHGMDAVLSNDPSAPGQTGKPQIAAVIGDSTFAHSGLTGLLNACWNKRDGLYIVLDNGTTAMTGGQPNPLSGERLGREDAMHLDYGYLARAFGIPDENFAAVDANSRKAVTAAIDDLAPRSGVRLLAVIGMCIIEVKDLKKIDKYVDKRDARRLEITEVKEHSHA